MTTATPPRSGSPAVEFAALLQVIHGMNMKKICTPDAMAALAQLSARIIQESGCVELLEYWQKTDRSQTGAHAGGRPAKVSFEAGLSLALMHALLGHGWSYASMAETAAEMCDPGVTKVLGLPTFEDAKSARQPIRRCFDRVRSLIDPCPGPRGHRPTRAELSQLERQWANSPELQERSARLQEVMSRLVWASTRILPRTVRRRISGIYSMDATVVPMPGIAPGSRSRRAPMVYEAGWYVRRSDTDGHDGTRQVSKRGRSKDQFIWGMELELVQLGSPDNSRNTPYPLLIMGASWHKPASTPHSHALNALEWIHKLNPEIRPNYVAADMLYMPNGKVEKFQGPLRAMGYKLAMDYPVNQLGVQDQYAGALLIDGRWHCPQTPDPLISATADFAAKRIDSETLQKRIEQRELYSLRRKDGPDKDGFTRLICPAEGTYACVQCPLKPHANGSPKAIIPTGRHLDPAGPICRQKTVTFPPEAGLKYFQDWPYMSVEWQHRYHHPRNAIEAANGRVKKASDVGLADPTRRLARSTTAQALFAAIAVMCVNIHLCQTWFLKNAPLVGPAPYKPRRRAGRRDLILAGMRPTPVQHSPPQAA